VLSYPIWTQFGRRMQISIPSIGIW